MKRFLANAETVASFPTVKIAPYASVRIYARITTDNAGPGVYEYILTAGDDAAVVIRVKVLDILLPHPKKHYYNTWGSFTKHLAPLWPLGYFEREERYRHECGINVYRGMPDEIPIGKYALKRKSNLFYFPGIPRKYVDMGYTGKKLLEDFTKKDWSAIFNYLDARVEKTKKLGLTEERWMIEFWDEPGVGPNTRLFAELAKKAKERFPKINIYCNPCCWTSKGFASPNAILNAYEPWYNQYVDVSVPIKGLLFGYGGRPFSNELRKLWLAKRKFNAYYIHPCPGRKMFWNAFKIGLNGWGYYSYYSPRGNPWDDMDGASMDYQVVYPGAIAPVPTLQSESMREGWDDYRMLLLLKKCGKIDDLQNELNSLESFDVKRKRLIRLLGTLGE
jgi:hypothetical protein